MRSPRWDLIVYTWDFHDRTRIEYLMPLSSRRFLESKRIIQIRSVFGRLHAEFVGSWLSVSYSKRRSGYESACLQNPLLSNYLPLAEIIGFDQGQEAVRSQAIKVTKAPSIKVDMTTGLNFFSNKTGYTFYPWIHCSVLRYHLGAVHGL